MTRFLGLWHVLLLGLGAWALWWTASPFDGGPVFYFGVADTLTLGLPALGCAIVGGPLEGLLEGRGHRVTAAVATVAVSLPALFVGLMYADLSGDQTPPVIVQARWYAFLMPACVLALYHALVWRIATFTASRVAARHYPRKARPGGRTAGA